VYAGKSGQALQFKALVAGTNITLSSASNTITIDASAAGEANTASNLGAGEGVYNSKSGVDLRFRSLVAGTNITLASASNTITIDASAAGEANTASNLGAGEGVYNSKSGIDLRFRSLVAGTNITLQSGSDSITIDASAAGEANTASNLVPDFGLYASKSGVDIRFKALTGSGGVSLSSGSTTITITGEQSTGSNVGGFTEVFKSRLSGGTLEFRTLEALTGTLGGTLNVTQTTNTIQVGVRALRGASFFEDDFCSNSSVGRLDLLTTLNGNGSAVAPSTVGIDTVPIAQCCGVLELKTGTNSSGRAAVGSYASAVRLDFAQSTVMEWRMSLQALSTATQEYVATFGWMDNFAAGDHVDGAYFEYDRLTAGDFWRCCTATNSSRTKVTTSAPVTAGSSFDRFTIYTNSGSTVATFYVNDSLVATISSSMPIGVGRSTGYGAKIQKSAGTTSRSLYSDYISAIINWPSGQR
jgi:hypothetical protein